MRPTAWALGSPAKCLETAATLAAAGETQAAQKWAWFADRFEKSMLSVRARRARMNVPVARKCNATGAKSSLFQPISAHSYIPKPLILLNGPSVVEGNILRSAQNELGL